MKLSADLMNKMVKRGAKRYAVDSEARALADIQAIMTELHSSNWGYALHYNNFATAGTAARIDAEVVGA